MCHKLSENSDINAREHYNGILGEVVVFGKIHIINHHFAAPTPIPTIILPSNTELNESQPTATRVYILVIYLTLSIILRFVISL